VPCLTISEARNAFRDAVLGLEYLHYQGIIHRDIKPANLLVTSHHRVKISDFGVSYLGRPIRDDEIEQVTETDATELDDARELSKTVGTPAFYAPELCYTGDDFVEAIGKVPKITGAIDIWSLGVTLYGMIFGRLPFVSDDEYSMFQTIVKNDLFIPTKRLKPVELGINRHPPNGYIVMNSNKRMEEELAYEDLDEEIQDLLRRLLIKDPTKRITIKEIKHHPWVLRGLSRPDAWIEGHENLRRKQEEASSRLSIEKSNSSGLAAKEQDSVGREVEAEFHLRLLERRIEQTLIITGRSFGSTNLIVLDSSGKAIAEETLTVEPSTDNIVSVYRTAERHLVRQTFSCTPDCSPTLTLGDDNTSFGVNNAQIKDRSEFSKPTQ